MSKQSNEERAKDPTRRDQNGRTIPRTPARDTIKPPTQKPEDRKTK